MVLHKGFHELVVCGGWIDCGLGPDFVGNCSHLDFGHDSCMVLDGLLLVVNGNSPKLEPPPLSAQNRSGFSCALALTMLVSARTTWWSLAWTDGVLTEYRDIPHSW